MSDWIQTGRYVVGLDPQTDKNGPTERVISGSPNLPSIEDILLGTSFSANQNADSDNSVELRISGSNYSAGQTGIVTVGVVSNGNASTFGATIEFDPDLMTYVGSSIVEGRAGNLTLIQNDLRVDQGLLGILVASNPGDTLPPGNIDVLELEFELNVDHHSGPLEIDFSDKILRSAVSNRNDKKLEFTSRNITSNVRSITNFNEWARIHESRSENGNGQSVVLNEDEDSDGDGLSNAVEFVLGTNPVEENKIPLEASVKVVDGKPVFEAATQIITERGDVEVEVVPLESLGAGSVTEGNGNSATESKFGREKRTFIFQADQQSGFYIVRIKNKNS